MEKCVTDSSITNVLMLLDPLYAEKANEHSGGVGTETQIISANVYNQVTQDKFIPVVMMRDKDGNVCKPAYLQGILHFDLSNPEKYEETYQRLVKTLYGVDAYEKPELGKKPFWVDTPIGISPQNIISYDTLKNQMPYKAKEGAFGKYLNEISQELIAFINKARPNIDDFDKYISLYDETESGRNKFLQLLKSAQYVEGSSRQLAAFFEETTNSLPYNDYSEIIRIRIHELFIYVIALFLKNKDYASAGYLLGKTYFDQTNSSKNYGAATYRMFHSAEYGQRLDNAVNGRDSKDYYTGTGQHWIETIAADFCSKELFLLADIICCNYSLYGKDYIDDWCWFPITYVYDQGHHSVLEAFSRKMASREYAQELLPLFGYETIGELKDKMRFVLSEPQTRKRDIRYAIAFESVPLLNTYIKVDDVGSLR